MILIVVAISSCQKEEDLLQQASDDVVTEIDLPTFNAPASYGKSAQKAFSVDNVQQAVDNVLARTKGKKGKSGFLPSHYYYRFQPSDENELLVLEDSGYDIWDFPLDIITDDIPIYYVDPSLPSSSITYIYTLIPRGMTVPNVSGATKLQDLFLFDEDAGDEHDEEVITDPWVPSSPCDGNIFEQDDMCNFYLTDTDKDAPLAKNSQDKPVNRVYDATRTLLDLGVDLYDVYNEMMDLADLPEEKIADDERQKYSNAKMARWIPSGRLTVEDNASGQSIPLAYVRVKSRRTFKMDRAFTNGQGNFLSDKKFRKKATVVVKFKNGWTNIRVARGLRVWQYIFARKHKLGKFEKAAMQNIQYEYSYNPDENSGEAMNWVAGVTMNAWTQIVSYYGPPPQKTRVLCRKNSSNGAAMIHLMLRPSHTAQVYNLLSTTTPLWSVVKHILYAVVPDITLDYHDKDNNVMKDYDRFLKTGLEEYAHARHYSKVGKGYWLALWGIYLNNAIWNGGVYGEFDSPDNGRVAVVEGWGKYMSKSAMVDFYTTYSDNFIRKREADQLENQRITTVVDYEDDVHITQSRGWMPVGLFHDCTDTGESPSTGIIDNVSGITRGQMSGALHIPSNAKTMDQYISNLSSITGQSSQLNQLKNEYAY